MAPSGDDLADTLFHRWNQVGGNGSTDYLVDEFKTLAARQWPDAQENLTELAGAAGLFLVAVVAFGRTRHGFAIGDARRARVHFHVVTVVHPLQHHAHMQFSQAPNDCFIEFLVVLDLETGIFLGQPH